MMSVNENAALWFVDRHLNEGRADKIAFQESDGAKRTLTYRQLSDNSADFAGALHRHGVHREERVAMIVLDQTPAIDYMLAWQPMHGLFFLP